MAIGASPMVSVIIPTYCREEVLCNTIRAVLAQDYPNFELIVVDQSPSHEPETQAFLDKHQSEFRLHHCDLPSRPNAKNVGIQNSRGEIVLFLDDDVALQPKLIGYHVENYADPQTGAVTGRIIEEGKEPDLDATKVGRFNIFGRIVGKGNRGSRQKVFVETVFGGNMSFRRTVIDQVGLFDTDYVGTAFLEESDFSYRVRRLGHSIVFEPRAELLHLPQRLGNAEIRGRDYAQWYRDYAHNNMLFSLKNLPRWHIPFVVSAQVAIAVKHALLIHRSFSDFLYLLKGLLAGIKTYRRQEGARQVA